jgi:hypothetical protein
MSMLPPKAVVLCCEVVYATEHAEEPTKKEMVVLSDSEPEVPVTVIVAAPGVAVLLAAKVNTLVPVVGLVPNVAVTPAGTPEAASVTEPVNPFRLDTVMVSVAVFP